MLGFVESFNAKYACRFCTINYFQRSVDVSDDTAYYRPKESYKKHLDVHDASKTGIKEKCCFCGLPDFDPLDNTVADILHDKFEGTFTFDICALLVLYIEVLKYFSEDQLNDRITSHDWGKVNCNKPQPISLKDLINENLKMSDSETFHFCCI